MEPPITTVVDGSIFQVVHPPLYVTFSVQRTPYLRNPTSSDHDF